MVEATSLIGAYPVAAAATALFAGVASSVSPCTIAAVPLVIGYVGGYGEASRYRAFLYALAFVLGLSLAFTATGLAVALAGAIFLPAGGVWRYLLIALAIAAGVSLVSGRALPGLGGSQCGPSSALRWKGGFGAFVAGTLSGVVFAPCATPVMVGILALIGSQQDVVFGTLLMFLYALGHGALLLVAGSSVGFSQWVIGSRWTGAMHRVFPRLAGFLLIAYAAYLLAEITGTWS